MCVWEKQRKREREKEREGEKRERVRNRLNLQIVGEFIVKSITHKTLFIQHINIKIVKW